MVSTVQILHTPSWDLLILAYYPTPLWKFDYQQGQFQITAPALSQTPSRPSFVLKLSAGCIVPALYPGARAEIVTAINRMKNPRSCCRKKKNHTCLHCKLAEEPQPGTTAFILACCSRFQKVCFRASLGYKKRSQLARRNEIQQYPLLIVYLYPQQTNESIWEERNSISSPPPASTACIFYCSSGVITKAWVSS